METFAELLRRHRGARSLTQEELAERARLTTNAVGALERGERRRPYPHTVRVLADALELDQQDRAALLLAASPGRQRNGVTRRPAAGSEAAPTHGWPVPVPAEPVIGRDDEVDTVAALLHRPVRRVITLTGPGGSGKTTLALTVAARVRTDFPGGVVVVELADVVDPKEVLPAIATALATPVLEQPVTPRAVAAVVAGRRMLLVLDNLERLLDCGPELARLLALSPDLVLLITSRAPLRVRPEQEVRVAPLPHDAAVRLFRDRAAAAGVVLDSSPETTAAVDTICTRCDGLPLAVELAAAAAVVLGPTALLARLDTLPPTAPRDLPARQQSIAATLAWSYELLSAPARALLARLSVCSGGFSLALAEEVGGGDPDAVLTALTELGEHSLVSRMADVEGTERFRLLEPVRQDAAARLGTAERDDARNGLVRAMLDTARGLGDDLRGPRQPAALRLVHADRPNLREAYEQLLCDGDVDDAVDLLAAVWSYFTIRSRAREGILWAERLRGRPMSDQSRVRWLLTWTGLSYGAGDVDRRRAEDALALAERTGDGGGAADAAVWAAWGAAFTEHQAEARRLVEVARARGVTTRPAQVRLLLLLATSRLARNEDDLDEADQQLREAEALARGLGPFDQAIVRLTRALVTARRGEQTESASLLGRSVLLFLAVESHFTAFAVTELAAAAVRLEDLEMGARLFGASGFYLAELDGDAAYRTLYQPSPTELARARRSLGDAAFAAAWEAGRNATADDVAAMARTFIRDSPS